MVNINAKFMIAKFIRPTLLMLNIALKWGELRLQSSSDFYEWVVEKSSKNAQGDLILLSR